LSIAPPETPETVHEHGRERERRVALFGGTFDPIHIGHLAVARAAERRFHLDEIQFIPTGHPPHKHRRGMASYADRYAMVSIACADHPKFVPSLAESGPDHSGRETFYSVDTVRHYKQKAHGSAHFYFLLGADSFLGIPNWKDYETLLGLCDFIVASRPGFNVAALRLVIPPELFARRGAAHVPLDPRAIPLRRTVVYVLDAVSSHVSATDVRHRLDRNHSIHGLVPPRVEEYINKKALYR
jgi:nicotinate-nucleotide adenylyltransferase